MSIRSKVIALLLSAGGGLLVYKAFADLASIALAARAATAAFANPSDHGVPPARTRPAPAVQAALPMRATRAHVPIAAVHPAASVTGPPSLPEPQTPVDAPGGLSVSDLDARIRPTADHRYDVDRTFLEQLFDRGGEHLTRVEVAPIEEDGRIAGVSLQGIEPSSLLAGLGLQDGDWVRSINGRQVLGRDELLDAYARFKHDDHVTVAVVRDQETLFLEYALR